MFWTLKKGLPSNISTLSELEKDLSVEIHGVEENLGFGISLACIPCHNSD